MTKRLQELQAENDCFPYSADVASGTISSSSSSSNDSTAASSGLILSTAEIQQLCVVASSAPVMLCSVLGSFLAQEVVKSVSHSGEPAFNVFVFSGTDFIAKAFPVKE